MYGKKKLTREVLYGLALGALTTGVTGACLPGQAAAMTLTEYKQALQEGRAFDVPTQSRQMKVVTTSDLASTQEKPKIMRASGENWGAVIHLENQKSTGPAEIRTTDVDIQTDTPKHLEEGSEIAIVSSDVYVDAEKMGDVHDSSTVSDFSQATFKMPGGGINLLNGTVIATAANIYGSYDPIDLYGGFGIGASPEDMGDFKDVGSTCDAHAKLKLVGNTKFNGDWTDEETGETVSGRNFITIYDKGILEANSAQIFDVGLGEDGLNKDPEAVRQDADQAINFHAGTLLLDDDYYNQQYLEAARRLIQAADGGTTTVSVKDGARLAVDPVDARDVQENGVFQPTKYGKAYLVLVTAADKGKYPTADVVLDVFNATSLKLAENAAGGNTITVNGSTLHLGNASEKQSYLVTAAGKVPAKAIFVTVRDNGTLALGLPGSGKDAVNILPGDVALGTEDTSATLKAVGGTQQVGNVAVNAGSKVDVGAGARLVASGTVTLAKQSEMQVSGTFQGKVTVASDAVPVIRVGTKEAAGTFVATSGSTLAGAQLFMDPVWKDGATIADASSYANGATNLDYSLTVGQNSVASLGTESIAAAQQAFANSHQSWGEKGITAALYLDQPVTLASNGGVKVDGSLTESASSSDFAAANTAAFGANSLLLVNAKSLDAGKAALTPATAAGSKLAVDKTAKLYLDQVSANKTYTVANGFADTSAANGWYKDAANILLNKRYKVQSAADGVISVANNPLAFDAALPNLLTALDASGKVTAGTRYLNDATSGLLSDEAAQTLLNTAAQPAEAAGASFYAVQAVRDFADEAQQRYSYLSQADVHPGEFYVKYGHRHTNMDGLQLTGLTAQASDNYNSVSVGYDFPVQGLYQSGLTVGYGKGSADGTLATDSYKAFGLSYYGRIRQTAEHDTAEMPQNALLFDAGVYGVKHDIKGVLSGGDDKQLLYTLGVREEYRVPQKHSAIVPHIGLRWIGMNNDAYDMSYGGQKAFRYAPENRNFFLLPVGVGAEYDATQGNWHYRMRADLSYVGHIGATGGSMRVSAPGLDASDIVGYDVLGKGTYEATLGLEAESKTMGWSIGYRYQGNSEQDSHTFGAHIAWKF